MVSHMDQTLRNAHLRDRIACLFSKHVPLLLARKTRVFASLFSTRGSKITDRFADDIGLTQSERAQLNVRLPSFENRHPML